MRPHALYFVRGKHGLVVDRVVALGDVVGEKLQMLLRKLRQHAGSNGTGSMAAQRRVQHVGSYTNPPHRLDLADRKLDILLG